MRRFRGRTWLNFAATLLLAAVISPMADATDAGSADGSTQPPSAEVNLRLTQVPVQGGASLGNLQASSKPTNLIARVDLSQIPVGATGGVYYDTPPAQSEPSPSAASDEKAPFGIVAPGKWASVLSTVLLVGFLFLRRAS